MVEDAEAIDAQRHSVTRIQPTETEMEQWQPEAAP
jgi:hypothetical protein